ncbi:hypothetical protein Arub01_59360 [Actinomadura rubrobrunea]|uniref:ribonucleoside-diphosphate reductase n=1 Tax=Actinomadura rubrobrunea TaxID=115335 RepID=A0A9W6Q373_9ACTN|nr:hypothetical protein [Actinomadura rubrobrunea]GLW67693.1 hypothetical protein Arub01_59360 [Actinomadura rubrobrunea]
MPKRAAGTTSVTIASEQIHMTTTARKDGSLGEVIIQWGTYGTTTAGLAHAYAEALTVGLQHGVPLSELVRQGRDLHFVPHGATTDPQISRARSVVDWAVRRLDLDWAPNEQQAPPGTAEQLDQARTRPPREDAAVPQPSPDELTVFWNDLATGIGTPSAR